MTATSNGTQVSATAIAHPLDPATPGEFEQGLKILERAGVVTSTTRFSYYGLEEPPKAEVLAHQPGDPVERRLRALLVDLVTGALTDVVVSVTAADLVSSRTVDPVTEGQFPILNVEFERAEQIVHADEGWRQAMARRGLTDITKIRACPLTAGNYELDGESGRRIVRVLAFLHEAPEELAWAHPIDGVAAYVDLVEGRVLTLIDELEMPVPAESGDYNNPDLRGPERTSLRPIEITQPEGVSFTVDGHTIEWENWSLRVGFDAREGLVLHQISFDDAGERRPIIYRASVPEMVVPYGDPGPFRYWQNYFDTGEYLVGKFVNSLELGCDCLGEITYLDATIPGDDGRPTQIPNAICIHEEDHGVLWKHTDMFNGSSETRRQRRLVISFFATIGNYDYGFYWYLYLDGKIELEIKLTGVLFTSGYRGKDYPYATEVAPGLGGPAHQHLFSARLDMMVDGLENAVEEIDVHGLPVGPENPWGNAISRTITRVTRESEGGRLADATRGRTWRVINPGKHNRFDEPVAWTLFPQQAPTLIADPESPLAQRAGFASRQLWVTRYDHAERYPAGDFVNQHPGGGGVSAYAAADRDLDGTDIVLWHTFGPTHFPRPEDWPVMPVETCGFVLKPSGFFGRNPTLDVPRSGHHCHHHDD
jgi:primary-amine oxidase